VIKIKESRAKEIAEMQLAYLKEIMKPQDKKRGAKMKIYNSKKWSITEKQACVDMKKVDKWTEDERKLFLNIIGGEIK